MDSDANNKLLEEEEQEELKDFWFPKDDSRINNFSTLTNIFECKQTAAMNR